MTPQLVLLVLLIAAPHPASASRPAPHLGAASSSTDGAALVGGADVALAAARLVGLPTSFSWSSAPEWGPAADVAVLNRTLTGGGFHRDLTYTLALRGGLGGGAPSASAAAAASTTATTTTLTEPPPPKLGRLLWRMAGFDKTPPASSCTLTVVQPLPPGLFADPYQLEGAVRAAEARRSRARRRRRRRLASGGGGDGENDKSESGDDDAPDAFRLLGPLDLELPAPACLPTALVVQKRLPPASVLRLRVPLHAKYPAAAGGGGNGGGGGGDGGGGGGTNAFSLSSALASLANGHALVDVPLPLLALRCEGHHQQQQQQQQRRQADAQAWRPPRRPPPGAALAWPVPAGSAAHLALVSWGTFFAAAGAAAVVVGVVWREAPRLGV